MTGLVTIRRRVPIRTLLHSRIMLSNFGICPNFRFLDGDGSSHKAFRNCWDVKETVNTVLLTQRRSTFYSEENNLRKETTVLDHLFL